MTRIRRSSLLARELQQRLAWLVRELARALPFLVLPLLVLPWLAPVVSPYTIGADYADFTMPQQLALQLSLRTGTFPLYVPGFALGQSSAAATLGQLYHPIAHLAARLPGYWGGGALEIATALNLLSLGIAQLVLHRVLRALDVRRTSAFVVSFLAVYNLRTLDLFRYGAALQNQVGYLLLCAALLHLATRGPSVARAVAIALATWAMLCGGHPQIAYLGFAGGVLLALVAPFYVDAFATGADGAPEAGRRRARAIGVALAGMLAGVLLAAAYLAPLYFELVRESAARVARDFHWVYWPHGTASAWTLVDGLMRPLHADVHGAYAGSALFVVPILLPLVALLRPVPRVVWACWATALLVLATTLAPALPLYRWLWTYVPGFAAFRVPGRVAMLAPLPLCLVLLWIVERSGVAQWLATRGGARSDALARQPVAALVVGAALAAYVLYALLRGQALDPRELAPPLVIRDVPDVARLAVPLLGVGALAALLWFARRPTRVAAAALVLAVLAQQSLVLGYGTWLAPKRPTPTLGELMAQQRERLGFTGAPGAGMETRLVSDWPRNVRRPIVTGGLARLDHRFATVASLDDAYAFVRDAASFVGPDPPQAVVESTRPVALAAQDRGRSVKPGRVELTHGSFNRLVLAVKSPTAALLEVRDPYSARWQAWIDDRPVPVERANALWLGIVVPAGTSVVELRYVSPAALAGMAISLATAWLLAVACVSRLRSTRRRALGATLVTVLVVAAFVLWQRSLYGGAHLGTRYVWPPGGDGSRVASRSVAGD